MAMRQKKLLFFSFALLLLQQQGVKSIMQTAGTDFAASFFPQYTPLGTPTECNILISSSGADATVSASIGTTGAALGSVSVGAGGVGVIKLRISVRQSIGKVENLGIRLSASSPIQAYALNAGEFARDTTPLWPIPTLSTSSIVAAWKPVVGTMESLLSVVAVDGPTTVKLFKPNVVNDTFALVSTIKLKSFQSYLFGSKTDDYTGWKIMASGRVAIFGGAILGDSPGMNPQTASNILNSVTDGTHMYEMIPPPSYWGTNYIIPSIAARTSASLSQQLYRVIATSPLTVHHVIANVTSNITYSGGFVEFETKLNELEKIICSKKCLVAFYPIGKSSGDLVAESSMTILPPIGMFSTSTIFVTEDMSQSTLILWDYYVIVVTVNDNLKNIKVTTGGKEMASVWRTPSNLSSYSVGYFGPLQIKSKTGSIAATSAGSPFLAFLQGNVIGESFFYLGGWGKTPVVAEQDLRLLGLLALALVPAAIGGGVAAKKKRDKKKAKCQTNQVGPTPKKTLDKYAA